MNEGEYRVTIEPRKIGGYMVTLLGPDNQYAVEVVDTVDEGREWAEKHVAWLRTKEAPVEFTL